MTQKWYVHTYMRRMNMLLREHSHYGAQDWSRKWITYPRTMVSLVPCTMIKSEHDGTEEGERTAKTTQACGVSAAARLQLAMKKLTILPLGEQFVSSTNAHARAMAGDAPVSRLERGQHVTVLSHAVEIHEGRAGDKEGGRQQPERRAAKIDIYSLGMRKARRAYQRANICNPLVRVRSRLKEEMIY